MFLPETTKGATGGVAWTLENGSVVGCLGRLRPSGCSAMTATPAFLGHGYRKADGHDGVLVYGYRSDA